VDARIHGRSPWAERYKDAADRIGEALDFMEACGVDPETTPQIREHRVLHQPRGAAARLRAGADAASIR
jgi:3-deoxy-D-arabino-heptulosonate 7-phosphate (DAHP) synthase class II